MIIAEQQGYYLTDCLENMEVHHHHHVASSSQISLTLSHYPSLSSIASGRSSGLHSISAQSCCIYVLAGRPVFSRPGKGVHMSTSLMISSLILLSCLACLVGLTLIVFEIGGRWPYSCCFVECSLNDFYTIARSILVKLPSSFFSIRLVSI